MNFNFPLYPFEKHNIQIGIMVSVKALQKLCIRGVISVATYVMIRKLKRQQHSRRSGFNTKRFDLSKYKKGESRLFFRFKKSEIRRLAKALKLPEVVRLRSRVKFSGLEGLCLLLRRLSYPNRLQELVKMFYRSPTTLSKISNWMLKHIYQKTAYLLTYLKSPWMDNTTFSEFAQVCRDAGSHYPNVVGFIDGTGRGICRPKYNQKQLYSGYKKTHLIKYQSVIYLNGLIGRLDGPFKGHRHDSAILNLSNLKEDLKREFQQVHFNFSLYGDPGYSNQKFIKVGFKDHRKLSNLQKQFNSDMSALRVSVEYGFGKILQQFAFLDFRKNQKVYKQLLREQYFVAALLVNCQNCLRPNQISKYFNCIPPSLETYLTV